MVNRIIIFFVSLILVLALYNFFLNINKNTVSNTYPVKINNISPAHPVSTSSKVISNIVSSTSTSNFLLKVPYISEAPENVWTGPWKNACEEASITMVDKYYKGETTMSIEEGSSFMEMLFNVEDKIYGSNANSDSVRSNYLVNNYSSFKGTVVSDPTIDQIKEQLREGHPVIAFHYGFDLKNKNIPFLATGSSYHSTVVVGYDDSKNVFLVNDPGDEIDGEDHSYNYSLYMSSIHDYDYNSMKANGPARVIFTTKS